MPIPTRQLGVIVALALPALAAAGCGEEPASTGGANARASTVPSYRQTPDKRPGPAPAPVVGTARSFALEPVADGLDMPNQLVARPGDDRLFVVEQGGRVRVVHPSGRVRQVPYLDVRQRIAAGGELGLLSVSFTPDGDGLVALFTDRRQDTRVVHFPAGDDHADAARGEVLLAVDQPYENHKGGTVLHDERGRLVVSLGDGGSAFDPQQRAQDLDQQLGKILRHDGRRWQTVAFGLRNPWRMSFDDATGMLWLGDVGQDRAEEVDAVWLPEEGQPRLNLGWAAYEGHHPVGTKRLSREGKLTWPLTSYSHGGGHCSVTGGAVYRGDAVDALRGRYVYGDFCRGTMWSLDARGAEAPERLDHRREQARLPGLTSFGTGPDRELYAVSIEGSVSRLVAVH